MIRRISLRVCLVCGVISAFAFSNAYPNTSIKSAFRLIKFDVRQSTPGGNTAIVDFSTEVVTPGNVGLRLYLPGRLTYDSGDELKSITTAIQGQRIDRNWRIQMPEDGYYRLEVGLSYLPLGLDKKTARLYSRDHNFAVYFEVKDGRILQVSREADEKHTKPPTRIEYPNEIKAKSKVSPVDKSKPLDTIGRGLIESKPHVSPTGALTYQIGVYLIGRVRYEHGSGCYGDPTKGVPGVKVYIDWDKDNNSSTIWSPVEGNEQFVHWDETTMSGLWLFSFFFESPIPANQIASHIDVYADRANWAAQYVNDPFPYRFPESVRYNITSETEVGGFFYGDFPPVEARFGAALRYLLRAQIFNEEKWGLSGWVFYGFFEGNGAYYDSADCDSLLCPRIMFGIMPSAWVTYHEFGHCIGDVADGEHYLIEQCPSPHVFDEVSGLVCAFGEGWADFCGAAGCKYWYEREPWNSELEAEEHEYQFLDTWHPQEDFIPTSYGAREQIEGIFACFLYSLLDGIQTRAPEMDGDNDEISLSYHDISYACLEAELNWIHNNNNDFGPNIRIYLEQHFPKYAASINDLFRYWFYYNEYPRSVSPTELSAVGDLATRHLTWNDNRPIEVIYHDGADCEYNDVGADHISIDPHPNSPLGYHVYRKAGGGEWDGTLTGYTLVGTVSDPSTTQWEDNDLVSGTQSYVVVAYNSHMDGYPGNIIESIPLAHCVITPDELPAIQVTAPNGGQLWAMGTQKKITWTLSNGRQVPGHFEIGRYVGAEYHFMTEISDLNAREYTWTVAAPASSECRVSVSVHYTGYDAVTDLSDNTFGIYQQETMWTTDGKPVCTASGVKWSYAQIDDSNGGAILAWVDQRGDGKEKIYAQRLDANGNPLWAADGVLVLSTPELQQYPLEPCLALSGNGGAIIAWYDARGDIYAQRISAEGTVQWATNGACVAATPTCDDFFPKIISDNNCGAIIVWDESPCMNLKMQRIDINGTRLWGETGSYLNCNVPNADFDIIPDGIGGAYVAWTQNGNGLDIYVQRIASNGTMCWSAVAACQVADDQYAPRLVSDGKRGVIVSWIKGYGGFSETYTIYAQRVSSTGALKWATGGIEIATASHGTFSYSLDPQLISDGMGGAVIVWEHAIFEQGDQTDLYAQRINDSGVFQWAAGGIPVCTEIHNQKNPKVARASAGRMVITWDDWRNADGDIYVQEIKSDGTPVWTTNGKPVCTATGDQGTPVILPGAIIAWMDHRDNNDHLYAQKVDQGTIPPQPVPPCTITYEFFSVDSGEQVTRFFMNGCPYGDFEFLRATLSFNVNDLLRNITTSEITLVKPDQLITFWSNGPIHADTNVVLEHAVNGIVKTTITHSNFSHNWDVNYRYLLGMAVEVDFYDDFLAAIEDLTVKSPDYTGDGSVNSSDQYYFNLTYGKSQGNPAFNAWFDFNNDHVVDGLDRPHMYAHKKEHLPVPMYPSPPATSDIGLKVVAREGLSEQGKIGLTLYLENVSDITTACLGLSCRSDKYAYTGFKSSDESQSEVSEFTDPTAGDDEHVMFLTANITPDKKGEIELGTIEFAVTGEIDLSTLGKDFALAFGDVRQSDGTVAYLKSAWYEVEKNGPPPTNELAGAYPNPFNPTTTIAYSIANDAPVNLSIYNVNGQLIRTLVDAAQRSNRYSVVWDGRDNQGTAVQSGIYFCRLKTNTFHSTRKLILLR